MEVRGLGRVARWAGLAGRLTGGRLRTRLTAAFAVVLVPLTLAVVLAAGELHASSAEALQATAEVHDLTGTVRLQADLRTLAGMVAASSASTGRERVLLERLDGEIAGLAGVHAAAARLPAARVVAFWPAIRAAAVRSLSADPGSSSPANDREVFATLLEQMRGQLDQAALASGAELREELDAAQARGHKDRSLLVVVLVAGLVLAVLVLVGLHRGLVGPLRRLAVAARRFGRGDLAYTLEVTGDDELGQVATAFREMAWQLSASRAQLEHRALHDELTGLANRVLFTDRVGHALTGLARRAQPLAVVFVDLDGFKTVNDTLGHAGGDRLLLQVAGALTAAVRPTDTVARLGGDEFAILIEDAAPPVPGALAARLHQALEEIDSAVGLPVQASLGIAEAVVGDRRGAEELLRDADTAMYAAKAGGSGRTVWFTPALRREVLDRLGLQAELAQAARAGQLRLHYQPIIDLPTGRVSGVEALLRWQHPTRGLLPPGVFIGIAETSGLIIDIGAWVLTHATADVARLSAELDQPLGVCVNVSPLQLDHCDFLDQVRSALAGSGLPPDQLTVEITESVLVADAEPQLRRLKQLGIALAVDDFGTGYSALHYLRRFPIDYLKIDRSFIAGLEHPATTGEEDQAIVRAIIDLARSIGMRTIAEGVEHLTQLQQLREMGCDQAQGFHLARPMILDKLHDWVREQDHPDRSARQPAQHPRPVPGSAR